MRWQVVSAATPALRSSIASGMPITLESPCQEHASYLSPNTGHPPEGQSVDRCRGRIDHVGVALSAHAGGKLSHRPLARALSVTALREAVQTLHRTVTIAWMHRVRPESWVFVTANLNGCRQGDKG